MKISIDVFDTPMPVDWDQRFLRLAEHVAGWSKDPSTKVGSVIVDAKRRVLGVGYNGFPRGIADDPTTLANRPEKLSMTVHAEMNSILNTGTPMSLEGATLYATLYPCNECAKAIIQAGIARVVTYTPKSDRWKEAHDTASAMFYEAGVEVMER
jgi:dCMP deaminase